MTNIKCRAISWSVIDRKGSAVSLLSIDHSGHKNQTTNNWPIIQLVSEHGTIFREK